MIRDVIPVTTVSSEIIEEKERKVGYISITTFGSETAKEWAIASEKLIGDGAEAIVIDVRGNPGGYLHSVGAILVKFTSGRYGLCILCKMRMVH